MNAPAQPGWVTALCRADAFDHPVTRIEVLETHISWVVLTGDYAYKIRKPLDLGFLDFTTLAARRHFCEEELRLNRQLAPQLYLDVVTISGSRVQPRVFGGGEIIDYAVRMREFPQSALASRLLAAGGINVAHIDALAVKVAAFHRSTGVAAHGSPYGTAEAVIGPARENFAQLGPLLPDAASRSQLGALRAWTEREFTTCRTLYGERQSAGFVRECHGDLHLGNIAMLAGELTPFDRLEFNPAFRWIDVMNEVAFMVMDLTDRGRADLAWRFLNGYLEHSGDYGGLRVLRYYLVYRALVRAKVHGIRAQQAAADPAECARLLSTCRDYVALATRCVHEGRPALVVMHGLSGSGKTFVSQQLLETLGAIRIRSDVERKGLHGLAPSARGSAAIGGGIYSDEATRALYARLMSLGRTVLDAGFPLILDAAFLQRWQRALAFELARTCGIPAVIVACHAAVPALYARVAARATAAIDASDAGAAVLTHQLADAEALTAEELAASMALDSAAPELSAAVRAVGDRIAKL
jgi:aminoglycoside phosphotransferase family enzyme/predicted kinase